MEEPVNDVLCFDWFLRMEMDLNRLLSVDGRWLIVDGLWNSIAEMEEQYVY